ASQNGPAAESTSTKRFRAAADNSLGAVFCAKGMVKTTKSSGSAVRARDLALAMAATVFLTATCFAQQSPRVLTQPNVAYLTDGALDGLPVQVAQPLLVEVPHKKLDPKYDVSKIGIREVGKGLDFYSLEKEIALGNQLSKEIDSSVRLVKDPVVTEYINRLGQRLVRNSDAKVPFTIKVVDDDEVNAYALPGGFFYVNTGLILAADNEAGLA